MKFALLFLLHTLVPVAAGIAFAAAMRWLGVDAVDSSLAGFVVFLFLGIASGMTAMDRSI